MSEKPDYYEVLGVAKTASLDEIKAAFKKIAMKCHPDMLRGKSDAEKKAAAEKFQLANEANEVLTDASKRAIYDQYGHKGLENAKNGATNSKSQSYTEAAGEMKKKVFSEADTFAFFEKRAEGGSKTTASTDLDGLTAEERRKKNAEERIKNRKMGNNGASSTKETFNETAEKVGDATERLKNADLSVDELQKIRDKAEDLINEIDAAIVRVRKNDGPKP